MKRICVYLGSSQGTNPVYSEGARQLGNCIASRGYELVYGGSDVGLMGILAGAALDGGARVCGVIPRSMHVKLNHLPMAETRIVETMHERKMVMYEMADAFIAMPGGLGTLDEIFEMLTWQQLGYHEKPCGFFNLAEYFDPLFSFLDHAASQGFLKPAFRDALLIASAPGELLRLLESYRPLRLEKWL